jgi:hypothetical protein
MASPALAQAPQPPGTLPIPARPTPPVNATGGGAGGGQSAPAVLAPGLGGPYEVKQLKSLGHEKISGRVCSVAEPFDVTFAAPAITFKMNFVPKDVSSGTLEYHYVLVRAGESHDAKGAYEIAQDVSARVLHLSLEADDHVVFKGFDGIFKNKYEFDLVPQGSGPCP